MPETKREESKTPIPLTDLLLSRLPERLLPRSPASDSDSLFPQAIGRKARSSAQISTEHIGGEQAPSSVSSRPDNQARD